MPSDHETKGSFAGAYWIDLILRNQPGSVQLYTKYNDGRQYVG